MNEEAPDVSAEDRERIRREEIFRQEIQRSLGNERSGLAKAGAVLNSPFFLLLFSALVISGLTVLIKDAIETRSAKKEQQAATQRLSEEIDARIQYFLLGEGSELRVHDDVVGVARSYIRYMRSPGTNLRILSIYPQYEKLTMLGLAKRFSISLRGRPHTQAEALRTQIDGLYLEATGVVSELTSPHQLDHFAEHMTEFSNRWFRGKYQAVSILK